MSHAIPFENIDHPVAAAFIGHNYQVIKGLGNATSVVRIGRVFLLLGISTYAFVIAGIRSVQRPISTFTAVLAAIFGFGLFLAFPVFADIAFRTIRVRFADHIFAFPFDACRLIRTVWFATIAVLATLSVAFAGIGIVALFLALPLHAFHAGIALNILTWVFTLTLIANLAILALRFPAISVFLALGAALIRAIVVIGAGRFALVVNAFLIVLAEGFALSFRANFLARTAITRADHEEIKNSDSGSEA